MHPKNYQAAFKESFGNGFYTYGLDAWIFDEAFATEQLLKQFQTQYFKRLWYCRTKIGHHGCRCHTALFKRDRTSPPYNIFILLKVLCVNEILWMDKFTIRNLELIGNGADKKGLLEIMDATKSPMGARLLKRWLVFPLQSIDAN